MSSPMSAFYLSFRTSSFLRFSFSLRRALASSSAESFAFDCSFCFCSLAYYSGFLEAEDMTMRISGRTSMF